MSRSIYQYPLADDEVQLIEMPVGAKIISVGQQDSTIVLWADIEIDAPSTKRRIFIYGTGWPIPPHVEYVGTVPRGLFVWHIFQEPYVP